MTLVALAAALVPPAGIADAAAVPTMTDDVTLTAPATGYLRVRLARTFDLSPFGGLKPPVTFAGAAPVGFALLPDRVDSQATRMVVVRTRTPNGEEIVPAPSTGTDPVTGEEGRVLRPGVYRLFFLTRGGGSLRLRLAGQPRGARRFRAAARVPWSFHESTVPVDATGRAPVTAEATLDYDGRQPGYVFAAQWVQAAVTAGTVQDACFYRGRGGADRAVPMCARGGGSGGIVRPGVEQNRVSRLWASAIYPEPPGQQSMRVCYLNAGDVRGAGALMFFLPAAA